MAFGPQFCDSYTLVQSISNQYGRFFTNPRQLFLQTLYPVQTGQKVVGSRNRLHWSRNRLNSYYKCEQVQSSSIMIQKVVVPTMTFSEFISNELALSRFNYDFSLMWTNTSLRFVFTNRVDREFQTHDDVKVRNT